MKSWGVSLNNQQVLNQENTFIHFTFTLKLFLNEENFKNDRSTYIGNMGPNQNSI